MILALGQTTLTAGGDKLDQSINTRSDGLLSFSSINLYRCKLQLSFLLPTHYPLPSIPPSTSPQPTHSHSPLPPCTPTPSWIWRSILIRLLRSRSSQNRSVKYSRSISDWRGREMPYPLPCSPETLTSVSLVHRGEGRVAG